MTTPSFDAPLAWIDAQRDAMLDTLRRWVGISSGTFHLEGLSRMEAELSAAFAPLGGDEQYIALEPAESIGSDGQTLRRPLGRALLIWKRPAAPIRVLLSIHYDTVFAADDPFQGTELFGPDTLRGPGVVDAKGGIIVLLAALSALERSAFADRIGWEVLLNPDEEIGSVGSSPLLAEAAQRNHLGLVFEPAFPDGALVGARKGSGAVTVVVRGRAAHAGRDFHLGRNAVVALAELITRVAAHDRPGLIINCGRIEGGGPINIVPELAIARFNVRADTLADQQFAERWMSAAAAEVARHEGIRIALHDRFASPPKPLDERSARLMDAIIATGRALGLDLAHRPTGGACDGNKLAAARLPVVDTLGPVGGELHSNREYLHIPSLTERAKLTALLLMKLAAGELPSP